PVDYKAGAPREEGGTNALWPADRVQLGLQMLLLIENGYTCRQGFIFYRKTKQRVALDLTPELAAWVEAQVKAARETAASGTRPPPLRHSPKCTRCSLAPVCLPDETLALAEGTRGAAPRRLMAARDDRRALYLNTQGARVSLAEGLLEIHSVAAEPVEVRLADVHHVALFGNIQMTTQAVHELCRREIPILYLSMGGWFYGITRGHALTSILTRQRQFARAAEADFCLEVSRQFVAAKIRNGRTFLMRNALEPPDAALARLAVAAGDALAAPSLESLLGIEGAAAAAYFSEFSRMIKPRDELDGLEHPEDQFTFAFHKRTRRPPADPVNALLSLAYSLLAKDCVVAI
ncbi:MAG: CRISPR-associated endonuclease Cas1, partial [Terrimicrobiaceae bacterium]|nr:CRISPR-associated endonuclease Cas1 [Terrimicrobiaceae bacterium]